VGSERRAPRACAFPSHAAFSRPPSPGWPAEHPDLPGRAHSAQLAPSQIGRVIMVGGTTRVPMVRAEVEKYFGRPPRTDSNPDEWWPGAPRFRPRTWANAGEEFAPARAVLLDVTPRALGSPSPAASPSESSIATCPCRWSRRASSAPRPTTRPRCASRSARENRAAWENVPLGELELADLQPARRGEVFHRGDVQGRHQCICACARRDGVTGAVREAASTCAVR